MFISVVLLCSSLSVDTCILAQNKDTVYPTEEACYSAGGALVERAKADGLLLVPYCVKIVGKPV